MDVLPDDTEGLRELTETLTTASRDALPSGIQVGFCSFMISLSGPSLSRCNNRAALARAAPFPNSRQFLGNC